MTPIKGWQTWYRWWSTWLTALSGFVLFLPELLEAMTYAWHIIPHDTKIYFSPVWAKWTGATIGVVGFASRFVRQSKPHAIAEGHSEVRGDAQDGRRCKK